MNESSRTTTFFSRSHLVQGTQALATTFCMIGVIFAGLDRRGLGLIRPTTLVWLGTGVLLSALAALVSRRARLGLKSLVSGSLIGFLYLGVTWLLERTGG